MKDMRLFGNMLEKLYKEKSMSEDILCKKLNCTKDRFYSILSGCVMPTFEQLDSMAEMFQTTVEALLAGDSEHYETTIVHCMHEFNDPNAREDILDIIESYVELAAAVK